MLIQSTLAKAFRGELVPTEHTLAETEGREYESAEQLLARERETVGDKKNAHHPPKARRAKATVKGGY